MKKFVAAVMSDVCHASLASLGGQIYEHFAHKKLKKGGSFECRSLEEITVRKRLKYEILEETTEEKTFPTKYESKIFNPGYWRPDSKRHASFDSLYIKDDSLSLVVFQMTISYTHPFKTDALQYLADIFPLHELLIHYYFVVPPHRYKDFKKQKMDGILLNDVTVHQYVMKVDVDDLVYC